MNTGDVLALFPLICSYPSGLSAKNLILQYNTIAYDLLKQATSVACMPEIHL